MGPQLLVLGLPRSGTQCKSLSQLNNFAMVANHRKAIAEALMILEYHRVYHMREVADHEHQDRWARLIDKKYTQPEEIQDAEIDGILHDFDVSSAFIPHISILGTDIFKAVADFPATVFIHELLRAYPNAKVILVIREKGAWIKSMLATLVHAHTDPQANINSPMRPLADKYHHYCWHDDFVRHGTEFYDHYLQEVRSLVKKDRLLEYRVEDGWASMCAHLEKQVPERAFPRHDDWAKYKAKHEVA
jgi:hypothetical protein